MKQIHIIIPLYNESSNFLKLISEINNVTLPDDICANIICVDDGSNDDTWANIVNLHYQYNNVVGIRLPHNSGKDGAIKEALKRVNGDAAVIMDGDGQHPVKFIPELIEKWESGSKIVRAIKKTRKNDSLFQQWSARIFNYVMKGLLKVNLDGVSDFMLVDKKVIDIITSFKGFGPLFRFDVLSLGFSESSVFFEVPKTQRQPRWSLFGRLRLALRAVIFNGAVAERMLSYFVLLSVASLIGLSTIVVSSWLQGDAPEGYPTLIGLIISSLFLNLASLAIIAFYLKNIFEIISGRSEVIQVITTTDDHGSFAE